MRKKKLLPVNIQFFADDPPQDKPGEQPPSPDDKGKDTPPDNGGQPDNQEYTVEGLLAQLTQAKADNARMKTEFDKVMTESGNLRKQLRAKQTAEEQEAEAKAEAERRAAEHTAEVEKELATMKATNRYLELGFSKDEAAKVAADEVNGDMDAWRAGVQSFLANEKKNAYAQARADLLKDMPIPQSGNTSNVDFGKQFNDAMNEGDTQAAVLALLEESKANNGVQS